MNLIYLASVLFDPIAGSITDSQLNQICEDAARAHAATQN
jgi:hypothetical protein